ncbi:DUF3221 domain-containing protein [Paenibacillus flagellatus]|uniref:DUF3221 domain-containing protein n=1 Tax=Paenibacillus flagellatus TaxID=2211139 RepID=A0A2V5JXI1_9BACL|nr:DUF3221 domain-containing protein [Paenibacillus flagellatus]PYI51549.1 hypothetical protein DLM86_24335 [Paenibacillus flagellatus]
MKKTVSAALLLGILFVAAGCGASQGSGKGLDVSIRGVVQSVNDVSGGKEKGLFVEGKLEPDTKFDKASIRVKPSTSVYAVKNGKKEKASMNDLHKGQRVEVSFGDNPVAESYPVQAEAEQVVILESDPGS